MKILWIILFLIAAFHFCLYYCNIDFSREKTPVELNSVELNQSKEVLEGHLKELKQFSSINTHG